MKVVNDNILTLGEADATDVRQVDVTNPPKATDVRQVDVTNPPKADGADACSIVFLDAPYRADIARRALSALAAAGWIAGHCLVIVESAGGTNLMPPDGFSRTDERRYGATALLFFEYSG